MAHETVLELKGVSARYNRIPVIQEVNLNIRAGEVLLITGPNGSGKSTLLKTISGFLKPSSGSLIYRGAPLNGFPPNARARMGISYVFQDRRIFPRLTVEENLKIALQKKDCHRTSAIDDVYDRYPTLAQKRRVPGGLLSGGEQQMLAIGRALVQNPKVILFDEPSNGLSPRLTEETFSQIQSLAKEKVACLLVEHRVEEALEYADRVVRMKEGRICFVHPASKLKENNSKMLKQPQRSSQIEKLLKDYNVTTRLRDYIEEHFRDEDGWSKTSLDEVQFSYRNQWVAPNEELTDALERSENLRSLRIPHQGILLLADPEPHANWGHPCWIATFNVEDPQIRAVKNYFPPKEEENKRLVIID